MLSDKRLIRSIRLQNFLSFGGLAEDVEMKPLNVFIGPNSSGKSNLFEAIGLLAAAPKDLTSPIREGGGVSEWLWKGKRETRGKQKTPAAEIDVTVNYPDGIMPLRHKISFGMVGQRFELLDEAIENERSQSPETGDVDFFYRYQQGNPVLNVRTQVSDQAGTESGRTKRALPREDLAPNQSVLSQRKDPDQYPEITYLGSRFAEIQLYREWSLGRFTPPRVPQKVDLPEDYLLEDAGNLGLVLNDLQHQPGIRTLLLEKLSVFNDSFTEISTRIHGGTVQVFLHEKGLNEPIPATRLSDGTLRYLCLLTLLCHPTPPPVVCIEEPELGLHPDVLPTIAELLLDASERTQLFVTTHSDVLVDALTHTPDSVVVCEKHDGSTNMQRLSANELSAWLKKYTLGQLWRRGELGGNRW
ncbi:MAG: AAA family ATPase [Phycisphaerae bacterium]|nr:AAA family ATPase [Phycisphaerae bacterium]